MDFLVRNATKDEKELDFSKPIRTKAGLNVTILKTDLKQIRPVVGILHTRNGDEVLLMWHKNGKVHLDRTNADDLENYEPVHRRWINIYRNGPHYETKEKALSKAISANLIACIPIEFKEGDGLEGLKLR